MVTLAIWGEVTPGAILTKCGLWGDTGYGGRNHGCNISWLSVKGCGCGERGKFAFSHWLDASPCDRVIIMHLLPVSRTCTRYNRSPRSAARERVARKRYPTYYYVRLQWVIKPYAVMHTWRSLTFTAQHNSGIFSAPTVLQTEYRCMSSLTQKYNNNNNNIYLFAIGGWKPEGHKPIRAGSKKK